MKHRCRGLSSAAAGLALVASLTAAAAQDGRRLSERLAQPPFAPPYGGPSTLPDAGLSWPDEDYPVQPGPSLPQTLRGIVDRTYAESDKPVGQIRDISPAIGACWRPPAGLAKLERVEITVQFSLRRDGTVFGEPRVTFSTMGVDTRARELLAAASVQAVRACTPLRLTSGLGQAVAGRPIAIRFIHNGPKGQGA